MIWSFWLILIGYLLEVAYFIDFFRHKSPVKGVIIKRPLVNVFLTTIGNLLIIIGYISLFWIIKWWIVVLLIISIPIQIVILLPIVVWIKINIYGDNN